MGPVDLEALPVDVATYGLEPQTIGVRCNYPGRWYYGMPRNLKSLGESFRKGGLEAPAAFYTALDAMVQRRQR
jgi:hypothetical protein